MAERPDKALDAKMVENIDDWLEVPPFIKKPAYSVINSMGVNNWMHRDSGEPIRQSWFKSRQLFVPPTDFLGKCHSRVVALANRCQQTSSHCTSSY